MLADNIVYLKKYNHALYEVIKQKEEEPGALNVLQEDTKNDKQTLKIESGANTLYLHSRYDPIREAESIIDNLEEREAISEDTHIVFYGLGLGYHVEAFLKRYPKNDFSIYEPSIEVFIHYLKLKRLSQLPLKQLQTIQCEIDDTSKNVFFDTLIYKVNKQSVICELPPYQKVFHDKYLQFLDQFREFIQTKRRAIQTNYSFKKRWILNSVVNFKEVTTTPNILMDNHDVFNGKTAVLVSAGPSLDFEIENLKLIKEKKLAYIFSVGSSINALIHNGLYPDAMCSYDPTEENKIVFKKLIEMEITEIPMIFGSSVGFETLQEYNGPKYHMLTNQDTVSKYFLKTSDDRPLLTVMDAPTIAVVTMELLKKIGFKEIILVGQNLAYLNDKNYAGGIDYHPGGLEHHLNSATMNTGELIKLEVDLKKAEDVTGNEISTTESYLSMKKLLELYIKTLDLKVINTTKGGIKIEGTQFVPMEDFIEERLDAFDGDEDVTDENVFDQITHSELYDDVYIEKQWEKMRIAYQEYQEILSSMKKMLHKIHELIKNKNTKQTTLMYSQLDRLIVKLEANDFAKVFALPMNRVEHELLSLNVKRLQAEKNELKKRWELILYVNAFIDLLYNDNHLNQQIMEILAKQITDSDKR